MFRWIAKEVELNRVGEGVVMDCCDLTEVRGQVELKLGTIGGAVCKIYANVRPGGAFTELASSTITGVGLLTTSLNVKAYAQCAIRVSTASGSADDWGILSLAGWSEHCSQKERGKYIAADATAVGGRRPEDDGVFGQGGDGGGVSGVPPSGGGPP